MAVAAVALRVKAAAGMSYTFFVKRMPPNSPESRILEATGQEKCAEKC